MLGAGWAGAARRHHGSGSDAEASLPATAQRGVQDRGVSAPQIWLLGSLVSPLRTRRGGCEAPGSRPSTLPAKLVGTVALGGGLPPLSPFLPQGDEQPFRSVWRLLGAAQRVLCVG